MNTVVPKAITNTRHTHTEYYLVKNTIGKLKWNMKKCSNCPKQAKRGKDRNEKQRE